ncbi:hypothetical protein MAR_011019 [Mya arenaria]|uniref:Uncharacterized protein n=1 Tax=Mya arenaria TaxID=6604 RepID=A0ABY7FSW3_MYAAR|nr:hypothetical protein MAR_011019 [Mya arenaria]
MSNSQSNSQDFFSQQEDFSLKSNSQSQGRRPQYEKYMSKPSLFRGQSKMPTGPGKMVSGQMSGPGKHTLETRSSNFQEQLNAQKTRSRERDERDMLNSIVSMVKECSDEVRHNLDSMRSVEENMGESLKTSIKTLAESLEESSSKILRAVREKEDQSHTISDLNRELRKRDDKIKELLNERKQTDTKNIESVSSLLESFKSFFLEQQHTLEQKVQHVLECGQEQVKLARDLGANQRAGKEENSKHFSEMKYTSQRQTQDLEKRVLDELVMLHDDFERQKRDLETFFRGQVQSLQQKQARDIEQHVHKGISEGMQELSTSSIDHGKQSAVLREIFKSQQRDIEKCIKTQTSEQAKQLLRQSQDMYSKHQKDLQKGIEKKLEVMKVGQEDISEKATLFLEDMKKTASTLEQKPWENSVYVPKKIQDQLNDLHDRHQAEIRRLETGMENQRKASEEAERKKRLSTSSMPDSNHYPLCNIYDFNEKDGANQITGQRQVKVLQKHSGFLSPRPPQGTWNSRTLFGRANPSPVATVLPQRQPSLVVNPVVVSRPATHATGPVGESINVQPFVQAQWPQSGRQLRSRATSDTPLQTTHVTNQAVSFQKDNSVIEQSQRNDHSSHDNVKNVEINGKKHSQKTQNGRKGKKRGRKSKKVKTASHKEYEIEGENESTASNSAGNLERSAKTAYQSVERNEDNSTSSILPHSSKENLYEFHDENSPLPQRPREIMALKTYGERNSQSKWLAATETSSEDSSCESSPSMSVTEIFIRRKVRATDTREQGGASIPEICGEEAVV